MIWALVPRGVRALVEAATTPPEQAHIHGYVHKLQAYWMRDMTNPHALRIKGQSCPVLPVRLSHLGHTDWPCTTTACILKGATTMAATLTQFVEV